MKLFEKIQQGGVYVIAEMSANHAGQIENAFRIFTVITVSVMTLFFCFVRSG